MQPTIQLQLQSNASRRPLSIRMTGVAVLLLTMAAGCSSSPNSTTTSSTTTTYTAAQLAYQAAFKVANWGSAATVTYPSNCTMTLKTTGAPPSHDPYYLAPVSTAYPTQVAVTPVSGLQLAVVPYQSGSIVSHSITLNICPSAASTTTATSMGVIGYMLSGEAIYNAFEGSGTPAMSDNVSYTFTTGGTSYTAKFIDDCNSHATPLSTGYNWHYHGIPTCLATQVDGASGPSHLLGFALDGFPIYGGRDISGNVIALSQLDACNGITSATPEFPGGAYHYVLPLNVTNKYSSLNCYTGSVSQATVTDMKKLACDMRMMKDSLQGRKHPHAAGGM